jgi:hypothetical protein
MPPDHQPKPPAAHQQERLAAEIRTILRHDRAAAILRNDWVQDGSLPIPSEEFIFFLACQSLGNPEWMTMAGTCSHEDAVDKIVEATRGFTDTDLGELVAHWWPHISSDAILGPEGRWTRLVRAFHLCGIEESTEAQVGQRALARRFIEALALRSVLLLEAPRIQSLKVSIEDFQRNEAPASRRPNQIASSILGWQSRVLHELGSTVSKSTFKEFLVEMYPSLDGTTPKIWAEAWKLAGWQSPGKERSGPRIKWQGRDLARKLKTSQ